MRKPKFISGPPGTAKTSNEIMNRYRNLLKEHDWKKIILLSHTNTAAEQMLKNIFKLEIPELSNVSYDEMYEENTVTTIHSWCNDYMNENKEIFGEEEWELCERQSYLFKLKKPTNVKKRGHPFLEFMDQAFGNERSFREHWKRTDDPAENFKPYILSQFEEMKDIYFNVLKASNKNDFNRQLQVFLQSGTAPNISALIVDEAQDSNKYQLKVLEKIATNVKDPNYCFVGDADQTIFEFAGSDADFFHELSKDAEQLEDGYRCGLAINKKCKQIIAPVWKKWGYSRVWRPKEGVIGKGYYLPDLENSSTGMEALMKKMFENKQVCLFTYRGVSQGQKIKKFLISRGVYFKWVNGEPHVNISMVKAHKDWPNFIKGEPWSLGRIKKLWPHLGKKVIVHGKGNVKKVFDGLINKPYTVQELIQTKFLKEDVLQCSQLQLALTGSELNDERVSYIRKVLYSRPNFDGKAFVEVGNFHQVKGLTYDNVIVDETRRKKEDFYSQLRLLYTGYSRGIHDYWTLAPEPRALRMGTRDGV